METAIYVCTHKKDYFRMNDLYIPIQVGKALSDIDLKILSDNIGNNISQKNSAFCELTALFWIWKNASKTKYIGLNHYRRYFNFSDGLFSQDKIVIDEKVDNKMFNINNDELISKYLDKFDIILPRKISYKFNLFTDYAYNHISDDLRELKKIVHDLYPEYENAFDEIIYNNNKLSHYNMFITKWEIFDNYCIWLFNILFEAENRINITNYNTAQTRIFGYFAERLLNVYVYHHKFKIKYLPIVWITTNMNNSYFKYLAINLKSNISFFFNKPIYL